MNDIGSLQTWEKKGMNLQDELTAASIESVTPKNKQYQPTLLPFSQIPKDLTKLVNNKLYSNVTFLFYNTPNDINTSEPNMDEKYHHNHHHNHFEDNHLDKSTNEKYLKIYGHKV